MPSSCCCAPRGRWVRRLAAALGALALLGAGAEPPEKPASTDKPAASEKAATRSEKSEASADARALSDELASVLTRLREARAAYYQRQHARAVEIKAAREPVRRLQSEVAELVARQEDADKELAGVSAEIATLQRDQETLAACEAQLLPAVEKAVAGATRFVASGFDYRRQERLARLGADMPPTADLAERVTRYWAFLQEELRIARSGETYTAQIPLEGGRAKPARVFRVGHIVQGFVTEDAAEAGLETRAGWQRADSPETEQVVRDAVDMLDRRRAPALLPVPIVRRNEP